MKVAVIGSRGFTDYLLLKNNLDRFEITLLISGGAAGADKMAEDYARANDIATQIILPEYNLYGRKAPIVRNTEIVKNADYIIAFWDGKSKGTANSISIAKKMGKHCEIIKI